MQSALLFLPILSIAYIIYIIESNPKQRFLINVKELIKLNFTINKPLNYILFYSKSVLLK